jgi:hypothetical protein
VERPKVRQAVKDLSALFRPRVAKRHLCERLITISLNLLLERTERQARPGGESLDRPRRNAVLARLDRSIEVGMDRCR